MERGGIPANSRLGGEFPVQVKYFTMNYKNHFNGYKRNMFRKGQFASQNVPEYL